MYEGAGGDSSTGGEGGDEDDSSEGSGSELDDNEGGGNEDGRERSICEGDGSGRGGVAHKHVHETSLDYKSVRAVAPTFGLLEHDRSLLDAVRAVPGLAALERQHVRIQINAGHGGCYHKCLY